MNKLKPRNKICFQNNRNIHKNLNLLKLKSKKWNLFKKRLRYRKEIKPEKRKKFFQKRLFEKQQFKNFYGCIHEYQLKNIFQKLSKKNNKINIFQKFIILLESRLDINLVRLKLVKTILGCPWTTPVRQGADVLPSTSANAYNNVVSVEHSSSGSPTPSGRAGTIRAVH